MSDMLVAQCPHCQTRFRVSQDHLQAAAGNVRCGACLKVFNALSQAQVSTTEASSAPSAADTHAQQPAPSETSASHQRGLLIHDHLELDNLDLQALGLDESILEEINPDARTLPPGAGLSAHERTPDSTGEPLLPVNPASLEPATPAPDKVADIIAADNAADTLGTDDLVADDCADADDEQWFPDFPRRPLADKPPVAAISQDNWKLTEEQIDEAFEFDSAADDPDAWDREFHLDDDLEPTPAPPTLSPEALDDVELHEAFKSAASSGDFAPRPIPTAAPPPITPTPPIPPATPAPAPIPQAPQAPRVPTVRTILTEPTEPTPSIESRQAPFGQDTRAPMPPLTAPPVDHGIFLRDQPTSQPAAVAAAPRQRQLTPEDGPFREPERPQPGRREPSLGGGLSLPDLIDEPLFIEPRPLARRPRRQWLWVMLSTIAALVLISQVAVYNFATLVHDERTRPMMEKLCFLAGCELPARVSIELIRSSNLVVRPHPDFPNALAIDVILYNRADFAQPFPVLRMTFSDVGGRELGNKLFQPAEYLGGELAGSTLMPPQTPVHVGLSMLNPGPEATSYNLDFLSP